MFSSAFWAKYLFCDFVPGTRPHFVFVAQLRTKQPAAKWVLAGVAIILDIGHDLKCHIDERKYHAIMMQLYDLHVLYMPAGWKPTCHFTLSMGWLGGG